jgi:hypothetical protein
MDEHSEKKMPDFDRLNDRIIAKAPKGPIIGIRTNLDSEQSGDSDKTK